MIEKSLGLLNDTIEMSKWFESGKNRVLMYHSIGGGLYDCIPASQLKRQLETLKARYKLVDLLEIVDDQSERKKIAVTFDDGFIDFYTKALPVLEDLGIQATVFLIEKTFEDSDFVHDPDRNYVYMSEEQVSELINHDLVTIGNHTTIHPDLTEIEHDEMRKEVLGTKHRLEDRFGVEIDRFAYPYNKYNREVVEMVRRSHSIAVCGGPRTEMITEHTDPCVTPRLNGAIDPSVLNWRVTDLSSNVGNIYSSFRRNLKQ